MAVAASLLNMLTQGNASGGGNFASTADGIDPANGTSFANILASVTTANRPQPGQSKPLQNALSSSTDQQSSDVIPDTASSVSGSVSTPAQPVNATTVDPTGRQIIPPTPFNQVLENSASIESADSKSDAVYASPSLSDSKPVGGNQSQVGLDINRPPALTKTNFRSDELLFAVAPSTLNPVEPSTFAPKGIANTNALSEVSAEASSLSTNGAQTTLSAADRKAAAPVTGETGVVVTETTFQPSEAAFSRVEPSTGGSIVDFDDAGALKVVSAPTSQKAIDAAPVSVIAPPGTGRLATQSPDVTQVETSVLGPISKSASEKPTTLPSVSPVKGEVTALEPAAIADAPSTESDFMQVAASSTVLTSLSLPTAVATASVDQLLASPAAGAIVMASAQASNGIRVAPTAPPQGKMQQTDASGIEAPQAGSPKADGILAGSQIEPEAASRLNLESGSVNDFNSTKSGAPALAPSDQSTGAVAQNTSSGATPSQTSSVATNSSSQPSLVQNLSNVTQLQFNQTDSASLELGVEPQLSDDLQAFSRTEVRIDPAALSQAGRSSAPQLAQLSGQIGDQILHRFNGQSSKFEMRLDPPELGKVDVRLEVGKDGRVTAVLAARDPAVVEALMRGAKTLENTLTQAGLSLSQGGVQVELDQRGSGQQFSNLMNQNDSHQDRQTGQQLQNGDAEISDVEAQMAPAADQPIQFQSWSRARLDVKA